MTKSSNSGPPSGPSSFDLLQPTQKPSDVRSVTDGMNSKIDSTMVENDSEGIHSNKLTILSHKLDNSPVLNKKKRPRVSITSETKPRRTRRKISKLVSVLTRIWKVPISILRLERLGRVLYHRKNGPHFESL